MQDEEQSFTVRDRRIAHEAGADAPPRPEPAAEAPRPEAPRPSAGDEAGEHGPEPDFALAGDEAGIDFSSYVFSLAHMAVIHLGLERHPETGRQEPDLPAAREMIDVLGMLEEKTRGNLTPEEGELISKMLYTLRVSFVEASRAGRPG